MYQTRMTPEEGEQLAGDIAKGTTYDGSLPTRKKDGTIVFEDMPDFCPNLLPHEVLASGSFGGSYFRDIFSGVTSKCHKDTWKELPEEWLKGLNIKTQVANTKYEEKVNKYGVNCGAKLGSKHDDPFGLNYWEEKGWIKPQDPYGWFCWYTRFIRGRRSPDDERQISRWKKCAGLTGRWRNNLIGKVLRSGGKAFDDESVSPVVRQTLQHWAYVLTEADLKQGSRRRGNATSSSNRSDPSSMASKYSADDEVVSEIKEEQEKLAKKREAAGKNRDARAAKRQKIKEEYMGSPQASPQTNKNSKSEPKNEQN